MFFHQLILLLPRLLHLYFHPYLCQFNYTFLFAKNIIEKDINKGENIDEAIVGVEELVYERTLNSSTLLLSNGMKQTTYYTEDIYYKNEELVEFMMNLQDCII